MTNRSDFTREEWMLLGNAPLAASAAVAVASPGGGRREAAAVITSWRAAGQLFPESELIQAVVVELDPQDREEQEKAAQEQSYGPQPTFDTIVDEAVELCGQAISLLEQKATREETEDYSAFVMHIITQVAQADNESGFLGLGGEPVSRAERSVMREIALALGVRGG